MIKAMLKMEWQSFINTFKGMSSNNKGWTIFGIIIGIIVFVPLTIFIITQGYMKDSPVQQVIFTSYILFIMFLILFFSSVKTIINDFFIEKDIQQLMTLPIGIQHIFIVKMIKMWLLSIVWVYLIISITMAVNLYYIYDSIHAIIVTLMIMLGLCLIYTAITFAAIFLLTKILPKNKINEIMTALIGIFSAVGYFIYIGPLNLIGKTLPPIPDFLLVHQLSEVIHLKYSILITYIISCAILFLGCAVFVLLFKLLIHYGQHDFNSETVQRKRKAYDGEIMSPVKAFRFKDQKMIFRDFREVANILPQVIIPIPYFIFVIMQSGGISEILNWSETVKATMLFGIAAGGTGFVVTVLSAQIAAKDAEQYDLLYSLPIDFKDVVKAKWQITSLLSGGLFSIPLVIFGICIHLNVIYIMFSVITAFITAMSLSLVGINIGISEPQISKKHVNKRISPGMSFVLMIILSGFIGAVVMMQFIIGSMHLSLLAHFSILVGSLTLFGLIIYFTMMKRCVEKYEQGLKIIIVD
ncbi:hypothetical protein LAU42_00885 [Macrococcus armenti]|uniref:hypothetical protein n=1 Tax=Macrococcus armenti TaxID=2875764 RepID=UPI001CCA3ED0|nr:hypothetical protein [Macrococcus armenti]UBH22531.1 hypothetical protein LAU42_00885 [Macrococcus armenti]